MQYIIVRKIVNGSSRPRLCENASKYVEKGKKLGHTVNSANLNAVLPRSGTKRGVCYLRRGSGPNSRLRTQKMLGLTP